MIRSFSDSLNLSLIHILLEDRFLHIRQAGQIQGKFNLQRFHVQRHIRHSISFIGIEFVGFIVIVTGRRSDLQKVGAAVFSAASIEPASVQVPAPVSYTHLDVYKRQDN